MSSFAEKYVGYTGEYLGRPIQIIDARFVAGNGLKVKVKYLDANDESDDDIAWSDICNPQAQTNHS